jgi:hypothetical protein
VRALLAAFVVLSGWRATPALADNAAMRDDVTRLFAAGWEGNAASRTASDQQYREIASAGRSNTQTIYAYTLVLMKQRRYEEAIKGLDAVLKAEPNNFGARQNKIRVLMLTKGYDAALVETERLSRLLAQAPQDQVAAEERRAALQFIGRMFGYWEGPGEGAIAAAALDRARREVEKRLSEVELALYDEARDAVLARYEEITGESQRGREEALSEGEKKREEARQELDQRRAEQQGRRMELLERGDKLRKEIQDNQAEQAKAEQPLIDRLALIDRQAAIPRRERALLLVEADSLRAAAARAPDPAERDRLLFRAQQVEILAVRYDADLAALERQAAAVNIERARVQERFGRMNASLAGELQTIDRELQAMQANEKRFALDEKRLDRPLVSGTRAVRALEAEAGAFTTYEPLPLEEDRQRLLDSLKEGASK